MLVAPSPLAKPCQTQAQHRSIVSILKVLNGLWSNAEWIGGLVCDLEMPLKDGDFVFFSWESFSIFLFEIQAWKKCQLFPKDKMPQSCQSGM